MSSITEALLPCDAPPSYGSVSSNEALEPLLRENTPFSRTAPIEAHIPYPRDPPPPYEDVQGLIHSSGDVTNNEDPKFDQPVIVVQPSYIFPSDTNFYIGPQLTAEPEPITCRSCKECVVTKVETRVSMRTHSCAMLCFVMGGCCCLGWLPYCVKKCKTKYHYCPKCDDYVGVGIEQPFCR